MVEALAEKLEHSGPAEKNRVASVPQSENSWQVHQSSLCQKEMEQSCLLKAPDCKVGRVNTRECCTLVREGVRAGAWKGKGGLHNEGWQVPRRRGRASKERASLGEVEGSMSGCKSSPRELAESWFHSKPASLLVVSLGKTLNGMPPFLCGRQVLGPSSPSIVVAQSDKRHANRACMNK